MLVGPTLGGKVLEANVSSSSCLRLKRAVYESDLLVNATKKKKEKVLDAGKLPVHS